MDSDPRLAEEGRTMARTKRFRVAFRDADLLTDLVGSTVQARHAALTARAQLTQHGITTDLLRPVDPDANDGTQLDGCVKAYVDRHGVTRDGRAPWGLVLQLRIDTHGPLLVVVAFGRRHPDHGLSVYQRAHRRLHP